MRNVSQIINGKRKIIKKPELLAPAGNLEKLKIAIIYGADAVFVGGKEFSLRSQASNFTLEDIKEAVEFASQYGAHIHVTCNIILHQDNLEGIQNYLQALDDIGVTAIIVADPYIMKIAKDMHLNLEVHVSTQLSTLNLKAIEFYKSMGMDRVVLGREVTYDDLRTIMEYAPVDVEYFIHGAMCIHYSGRCMLSNYLSRRDANRGGCSQSCRWYYDLYQNGVLMNQEGDMPFSMSSKDMSLIDHIGELIELGVNSFKIEGRMKTAYYVATTVRAYRMAIDAYYKDPENWKFDPMWLDELKKGSHRDFSTGFFLDRPGKNSNNYESASYIRNYDFIGIVRDVLDDGYIIVEQRNKMSVNDDIEVIGPYKETMFTTILEMYNEDGEPIESAPHARQIVKMKLGIEVDKNYILRKPIIKG